MNRELLAKVKNELVYMAISLAFFIIVFKLIFYKEPVFSVARLVLSLFWLFALPGYSVMLYWHEKLEFKERLVIGTAIAAAITGIGSYYLGLFGVDIRYHAVLLPLTIAISGALLSLSKKPSGHNSNHN